MSPCGMIMDLLRSHMLSKTRIYKGSNAETTVRWFPCKPGALPFPHWHAFGSPVWNDRRTRDEFIGPGVLYAGQLWRGKRYPAPDGQHFHGAAEWFATGLPSSEL